MVYENKLLFQAGYKPINLGQSATNCLAYNVYAYCSPMMVCTNNFYDGVTPLAEKYLK